MTKKYLLFVAAIFLSGCISVTSLPVQPDEQITKICIQNNPKVIVPNFTSALQEALQRHGIASTVYDVVPDNCTYHVTYVAYQMWDFVMFMSNAHLDLYKRNALIGFSDRHMPFGSGLDFSKWDATKDKVNEMVDQMLANTAPLPLAGPR